MKQYPQIQSQLAQSRDNLAFLSHIAGVDTSRLNVIPVCHQESRIEAAKVIEQQNLERSSGYITLEEAKKHLDVTVLEEGFNVLYDEDKGKYVGIVNYWSVAFLVMWS